MRRPLNVMRIRPLQGGAHNPISNTFGMVRTNHTRAHQGWDLLAPVGTPVFAIADGELKVGRGKDYGDWISLKFMHGGLPYYAFYAHLHLILQGNSSVVEGAKIALTGRSGNAGGKTPISEAHLHFEIRTVENPGTGLPGRIDPGNILGYQVYSSSS